MLEPLTYQAFTNTNVSALLLCGKLRFKKIHACISDCCHCIYSYRMPVTKRQPKGIKVGTLPRLTEGGQILRTIAPCYHTITNMNSNASCAYGMPRLSSDDHMSVFYCSFCM